MAKLNAAELTTFYADYLDCWNRRDLESYYSLYAPDLVFRDGSAVLHGVDALRSRYEAELRDHPDLTMECVRLFVDVGSQSIAAENIERGTGIELRGALFLTLGPEGRIAEIAEYLNSANATPRNRRSRPPQQKTPRRGGGALLGLLQGGEICISIYVDPWEVGGSFDASRTRHRGKRWAPYGRRGTQPRSL